MNCLLGLALSKAGPRHCQAWALLSYKGTRCVTMSGRDERQGGLEVGLAVHCSSCMVL